MAAAGDAAAAGWSSGETARASELRARGALTKGAPAAATLAAVTLAAGAGVGAESDVPLWIRLSATPKLYVDGYVIQRNAADSNLVLIRPTRGRRRRRRRG